MAESHLSCPSSWMASSVLQLLESKFRILHRMPSSKISEELFFSWVMQRFLGTQRKIWNWGPLPSVQKQTLREGLGESWRMSLPHIHLAAAGPVSHGWAQFPLQVLLCGTWDPSTTQVWPSYPSVMTGDKRWVGKTSMSSTVTWSVRSHLSNVGSSVNCPPGSPVH